MIYKHIHPHTRGELLLMTGEPGFKRILPGELNGGMYTIVWNAGEAQQVIVDDIQYNLPAGAIVALMANQSFRFSKSEQLIVWQFDRDFYCIVDHDKEVGCAGILFYGVSGVSPILPDEEERTRIDLLCKIFIEEFRTVDNIQPEMLQMLLKRLIIILTRLVKRRYMALPGWKDEKLDIVRRYSMLVEEFYREQHQVAFYAARLHKSPKTLANVFAQHNEKSPVAVIHDRIILEARRLLLYSDMSVKEVAYTLGFEDAAHFSNFFKRHLQVSPIAFRRDLQKGK